MSDKGISMAVVKRLPRYYRYLGELLENGVVRISSKELSEKMNVTASQIRQDLNNFGGFGQQGYGYNVEFLHQEIGKILGLDHEYHVIILGVGNLGQALSKYAGFRRNGFVVKALFDINEDIIGKKFGNATVYSMDELENYIKNNEVHIAVMTLPKEAAPQVAKQVVDWGVKAIWNFVSTDLQLPEGVVFENVHLAESLMRLSYSIKRSNED
ncbi:MAG: redox-sensing transcriptional repressor Rex [Lachnospiraceae bacterium]|nr:redox-sensing transcriptional repressor Rex [Lachnospiraceae bacterium]